jgi:hypothetical protein
LLALDLLILFWARGIITQELKVEQGSTCSGHDLLELLFLLLVSKAVLLLVVAFVVVVVPVGVVVLVGGVQLLPLEAVGDEVGGVTALKAALGDHLLFLQNLCKAWNFLASKAISSSWMLPYCSSEAIAKEDRVNSKADEIVLVGSASWPPTWALVIKTLLVREASWLGRPLRNNSWDIILLKKYVSKVAKSAYFSKAVIFIP